MRSQSVRGEAFAQSKNNENLAAQLAEREKSLEQARREFTALHAENARLSERLAAEQEALKQARVSLEDAFRSAAARVGRRSSTR